MALVYKTILSLVPLLAVSFSVLKGFGVHNQLEPLLLNFLEPLGEQGVEITANILAFVDNIKVGVLGAVGLGVLLYTVVSLIQQIESAFNSTWQVRRSRSLVERFSHYLSVLLVGPVLVFSAIGMSATVQAHPMFQSLLETETGRLLYDTFTVFLPFLLITVALTFIYLFVPNTRVKPTAALFGAVIAALLFKGASALFTMFIVGSTNYTAIYSAFATLIILILWLYVTWLIVLLGSSIAFYFQYAGKLAYLRRDLQLTPHDYEALALQLMVAVARRFHAGEAALSRRELADRLHIPDDLVEKLVTLLECGGFLVITDTEHEGCMPGGPPEEIAVTAILTHVRHATCRGSGKPTLSVTARVDELLRGAETAANRYIDGLSLKQLAHPEETAGRTDRAGAGGEMP